jgi:hypothetical protein
MGTWRKLFGPSREEIWRQLSAEIGARYVEGGLWKGDKVQATYGEWTLTLDTYAVSTGKATIVFTRMRAPYVNPEGFRFNIYRKSVFSELAKRFGMQDVENSRAHRPATRDPLHGQGRRGVVRSDLPRGRRRALLRGSRCDQGPRATETALRVVR